ncbi:GyrI-like domain-containing protein [Cryobacterium sp. SO2]|uniref:GyrI-like domain-containing protein n=1 Tax=Cryobacterium sp. SO2 TaxID=1897060 RepID=UPI00223E6556|nr:GyrI-like domain-containing protein [Cryobacterium sp. SO2]WEO76816.1 GyrI-like domain-containing protein [Cryobacterium sp. SO2]
MVAVVGLPYDVKRELRALYGPTNRDWQTLVVPPQRFLAVDGHGDPNTAPAHTQAVEALYVVAYTVKFAKKHAGRDLVVAPLEGLWYADDAAVFSARDKDAWSWTMLIGQPDWVNDAEIQEAIAAAGAKAATTQKPLPALERVRIERLDEGLCAQLLHVGSYDDEAPALARLHGEVLPAAGLHERGRHHEVYLGDPRRAAPEKLKTVLRQPVSPA